MRSKYGNKSAVSRIIIIYFKLLCFVVVIYVIISFLHIQRWLEIGIWFSQQRLKRMQKLRNEKILEAFVFWRVVWNSIKNLVCLDKETFIFLYLATYQTNFLYFWYCHQFISPKLLLLVDYICCKNLDLFQDGLYKVWVWMW